MGISRKLAFKFFAQGIQNYYRTKPLVTSFEVTHSCTANCKHCDKGGCIDDVEASPEKFLEVYNQSKPLVVQISGGEPLLRDDILDIVRMFKNPGSLPFIVFISNASLMTEEMYGKLKEAGVDQFGISLDFPDERHDENREIPGLFKHLSDLLPRLSKNGCGDIGVITTITSANLKDLLDIEKRAGEWGVYVNFSAYTKLRTDDDTYLVKTDDEIQQLREKVGQLLDLKRKNGRIINSDYVLKKYLEFFENGGCLPNCQAGKRCFVVNPDGALSPCAMKPHLRYQTQEELIEKFSRQNMCGECYVSMRANSEKSFGQILKDTFSIYTTMKKRAE